MLYALHRAHVINLDYPLRQAFRFRRGGIRLVGEPKDGLFSPEAAARADALVRAYHLEAWAQISTRWSFPASMFYLDMLETAFREGGVTLPDRVRVLEAGPSEWFYVRPLYALLERFGTETPREVWLDGVEVDAFHINRDLHSVYDWAQAFSEGLPHVRYLAQDVRSYSERVDLALMMFPFLFPEDHLKWGLPRRYLKPSDLLAHVWGRIGPGGYLVIANQGVAERDTQHRLLAEQGLPIAWSGRHDTPIFHYEPERYVTVVGPAS